MCSRTPLEVIETRASHDFPVFVSQRALSLHVQRDFAEAMGGTIWGGFEKGERRDRYGFFSAPSRAVRRSLQR
jgi:hypothetical protein